MKRKRLSGDKRELAILRPIIAALVARCGDEVKIPLYEIEAVQGAPMQIHAGSEGAVIWIVRARMIIAPRAMH